VPDARSMSAPLRWPFHALHIIARDPPDERTKLKAARICEECS
jgi:hypothetical protein